MQPTRISACIVVFNQDRYIKRCLDSLRSIADEIVIVHDGECSDGTLEICRKYTDKIFIQPHIGMSDPHFVFAFNRTAGDWILKIDADEYLPEESIDFIRKNITNPDVDGYAFLWKLWNGHGYITSRHPHKLILARRSKVKYWSIPHGIIRVSGPVKRLSFPLEHKPMENKWTWESFRKKQIPWARIHSRWVIKTPTEAMGFQVEKKDYPFGLIIRRQLPYLFPLFSVYIFIKNALQGEWWNVMALKTTYFNAMYELLVGYYVSRDALKNRFKAISQ